MTTQSCDLHSPARRDFLTKLSGAAAASIVQVSPRRSKLRLGGPIFIKSEDPAELARAPRARGYNAAERGKAARKSRLRHRAAGSGRRCRRAQLREYRRILQS
jgi:hypothetical protein